MSTTEAEREAILHNFFAKIGGKGGSAGTGKAKRRKNVDYSEIGKAGAKKRWAGHVQKGGKA